MKNRIGIIAVLLMTMTGWAAHADEGMWLPSLIAQRIGDMQEKGFKLDAATAMLPALPQPSMASIL